MMKNQHILEESPITQQNQQQKNENDEDKQLQDELNIIINRLNGPDIKLYLPALESLRQLLRSSTTSITSVPKPLKYMKSHYENMIKIYSKIKDKNIKENCADIISVLAMVMGNKNDCISYRLLANPNIQISDWGHEYIIHLSSQITSNWFNNNKKFQKTLMPFVHQIIAFLLKHNAETEACDLLSEIENLNILLDYVDKDSYQKIFLYLINCLPFLSEDETYSFLDFCFNLAIKYEEFVQAVQIALRMNDFKKVQHIFDICEDEIIRKQIAFLIAKQRVNIDLSKCKYHPNDTINDIISNTNLNQFFKNLARDLDIMDAKSPQDIYKSFPDSNRILYNTHQIDSARTNLSASFVNGFINAGFGNDKMFQENGSKWIYRNKEHGMLSATASLGLIKLWDIDGGLAAIDKYLYSSDKNIKAGSLLACGILNCGVQNDVEPAHALLSEYLWDSNTQIQISAVLGIGIAYAGSNSSLALKSLRRLLNNKTNNIEIIGMLSISIGLIAVGTCSSEDTQLIFENVLEFNVSTRRSSHVRSVFLGLGLLYLGSQSKCDVVIESLQIIDEPFRLYGTVIVEMCAYAGTGNVIKIQHFLHICSEQNENKDHIKKDKSEKRNHSNSSANRKTFNFSEVQMAAVIGVALVSIGDDIGNEMACRTLGHLMCYGEPGMRRAVPLSMALGNISNPKSNVAEMLNKFCHDNDNDVVLSAIFSLGLIGAGTNNARIANLLRQVAQYYSKDSATLFMTQIAQGLVYFSKGTITLCPYHSDHKIIRPSSLAALLNIIFIGFDLRRLILGSSHYLLYLLTPAIEVRSLITLDENLQQIQVPVRTGIAVDVVAQAGKPKTITGFQTNTTPVLLGIGERAELATDEYISVTPILEGFVILKKNENYN